MNKRLILPKVSVGIEPGKPIAIYDRKTRDVLAYIPDGKTKVSRVGKECDDCNAHNMKIARKIARLINDDFPLTPAEFERWREEYEQRVCDGR